MKKDNLQKENYFTSGIIQAVKSAISMIPELSALSFLVDQFTNYQQNVQYNNIVDTLNKHAQQIAFLMDTIVNKDYINSSNYANDVLLTMQKAKDEIDEDKRTVYASYLSACCLNSNILDKNKLIYLDIVGRISYLDFFILEQLTKHFNGKNAIDLCTNTYNSNHKEKIQKIDIQIHLEHLYSLALIERCDKEGIEAFYKRVRSNLPKGKTFKELNYYQRTYLGDSLLKFINKAKPIIL